MSGNSVYAGGYFTSIGGQSRNSIACLDATTGLATDWNPNVNAGNYIYGGKVYALVVSGYSVYVGGDITLIGGQPRNSIACIDAATGLIKDWNPIANSNIKANSYIYALYKGGNSVYVGGEFTSISGSARSCFAQFDFLTPQPPQISSITPDTEAIANGIVHIPAITGANLSYVASAKLVKFGKPDIIATNLSIISSTRISCDFNLASADTGLWDVIVSDIQAQSDTLLKGFSILDRAIPSTPLLVAPANRVISQNYSLAFNWRYAIRAVLYDCQIALDSDFATIVVDTTGLQDTAVRISVPQESYCPFYWRVRAKNPSGNSQWSEVWSFTTGNVGVQSKNIHSLSNAFSFSPSTRTIRYSLSRHTPVSLRIFDMRGKQVTSLVNSAQALGSYSISLGSHALPAGYYIVSFKAGEYSVVRRCALVR